jgi:CTP:molybdopterin cytidylyltransferase MocA
MGREKILLPFGHSTVLETILETLRAAGIAERVVILRRDLPEAAERARRAGAREVFNPHPRDEMLTSIRLGLRALSGSYDAVFIWPADHPAVSLATLERLASLADPGRALIPTYRSRRGHPVLLGNALVSSIFEIPSGSGLRELWRSRPESVSEIAVEDSGVVQNLDTPSEYLQATGRDLASPLDRVARAIRNSQREPDPFLCRFLRTRTWYASNSYPKRDISRSPSTAQYLCLKTMRPSGPDGALALPEDCTDERACFEPAPARSAS